MERRAVTSTLAHIGSPAVEPLISALNRGDEIVRAASAVALGQIGDPRAVNQLVAAAKENSAAVRDAAVNALEKLGWQPSPDEDGARYWAAKKQWEKCAAIGAPAVGALIIAFMDSDEATRKAAAGALMKIGAPAIEPLIGALKNPSAPVLVKASAVSVLGQMGGANAVGPLIAALKEKDYTVREAAAGTLKQIGAIAVEPLIAALKSDDRALRSGAIDALGQIGDARAAEPLSEALRDNDAVVRSRAADVLEKMGWQPALDEYGAGYWVAKGRWDKCIEIGAPAVEPLIAVLQDRGRTNRLEAAEALGKIGDARAIEPLMAALEENNYQGQNKVLRALTQMGKPAVEPLIAVLQDSQSNARGAAASALGEIGDSRAIRSLVAALKDEDACGSAADALQKLHWRPSADEYGAKFCILTQQWSMCGAIGAPAVEPLMTKLIETDGTTEYGRGVRREVAKTLVRLYQSRKLSTQDQQKILRVRNIITTPHDDLHSDDDRDKHCQWMQHGDHSDSHEDNGGIGEDFPL